MTGDMSRLSAPRLAFVVTATLICACGPTTQSDSDTSMPPCVEDSVEIQLEGEPAEYGDLHAAILSVPGTYLATATWLDHDAPTQITTTLSFSADSYTRTVIDQVALCSLRVSIPVHVVVETSDGYLMLDEIVAWGEGRLTQPTDVTDEMEIGTLLSTAPDGSAWLDFAVAQMWPDVAAVDDDAELLLELSHTADGLQGKLYYSRREIIDGTTVIYSETPLLEWGPD
jgi:hypothetical protein